MISCILDSLRQELEAAGRQAAGRHLTFGKWATRAPLSTIPIFAILLVHNVGMQCFTCLSIAPLLALTDDDDEKHVAGIVFQTVLSTRPETFAFPSLDNKPAHRQDENTCEPKGMTGSSADHL